MKTIAIFSGYILPHLGGVEKYTDNLKRELIKRGYKVIIVTSNHTNDNEYIYKENQLSIYKLPVFNIFKNRYPIIKRNRFLKLITNELLKEKIDVIIVNTRFYLTSHYGANFGKKNGIPVYLIEHGSNYVTLDNKFIDFFANRYEDVLTSIIKSKVSGFFGVSKACGMWLKHFKINYSGVWYNSIDTKQRIPNKKTDSETINFLYAGRLIKQKGVENILNSFIELKKEYSNIHLYIAGNGPEYDYYINNYQDDNITFLGKIDYEELKEYYLKTDIFLYPPLWPEGLPTSILEAGLMKCAVIGTNQGGIKEIIKNNKNGIIVSPTAKSIKLAMKKLIVDKDLRCKISQNLYKDVCDIFSWDVTCEKIISDIGLE